MHRLLRNFTITALVSFTLAAAILYYFHSRLEVSEHLEVGHGKNLAFIRILENSLMHVYQALLQPGEIEEQRRAELQNMLAREVQHQTQDTDIVKLKLFGGDGQLVFSTDPSDFGTHDVVSDQVQRALRGNTVSRMVVGERISELDHPAYNVLETYVPLKSKGRETPFGVLEVYSDISNVIEAMHDETITLATAQGVVLVALFFVLFFIVERADRLILKQHQQGQQYLEELRDAKDAAELGTRAKSEFLANMSHEIRTPMNAVIGFTDLLRRTQLDQTQQKYVSRITNSGQILITLIDEILNFSKIESGELTIDHSDFNIENVVNGVVELLANEAERKGIQLSARWNLRTRHVRGDAVCLSQALVNLVINAIRFTDDGEVVIDVRQESEDDAHCVVRFAVEDTGIGIAAQHRRFLFQPFSQLDSSTARHYGGTGLGLAITKRFVEAMDGQIGVDSEPGVGSTFWFVVRLTKQESPHQALTQTPTVAQTAPRVAAREPISRRRLPRRSAKERANVRVLVVEDNPVNRELLGDMVRQLGYSTTVVADGASAIAAFDQTSYDVILLDCQMPGMDGYAVASQIRQRADGEDPVIIAVTADVTPGVRQQCLDAGMNDYLAKPMRLSDLAVMLEGWLTSTQQLRQFGSHPATVESGTAPLSLEVLTSLQQSTSSNTAPPIGRVLSLFQDDTETRIQAIASKLESGTIEQASRLAHSLKGSCQLLGASAMVAHCETLCGDASVTERKAALHGLIAEFGRVRAYIDENDWGESTNSQAHAMDAMRTEKGG